MKKEKVILDKKQSQKNSKKKKNLSNALRENLLRRKANQQSQTK